MCRPRAPQRAVRPRRRLRQPQRLVKNLARTKRSPLRGRRDSRMSSSARNKYGPAFKLWEAPTACCAESINVLLRLVASHDVAKTAVQRYIPSQSQLPEVLPFCQTIVLASQRLRPKSSPGNRIETTIPQFISNTLLRTVFVLHRRQSPTAQGAQARPERRDASAAGRASLEDGKQKPPRAASQAPVS